MTVAFQILAAVALGSLLSAGFWHAGRPVFAHSGSRPTGRVSMAHA